MTTNRRGDSQFTSDDFVAFELVAGNPPPYRGSPTQFTASANDIQGRLDYVFICNTFCANYFEERYPHKLWVDFYCEYRVWHAWNKERERDETIDDMVNDRTRRVGGV